MSTQELTPVPQDHPLMQAWTAYQATEEYAITKRLALHTEYIDGSLWAAFEAGWNRRVERPQDDTAPDAWRAEYERLRFELEVKIAAWHQWHACKSTDEVTREDIDAVRDALDAHVLGTPPAGPQSAGED